MSDLLCAIGSLLSEMSSLCIYSNLLIVSFHKISLCDKSQIFWLLCFCSFLYNLTAGIRDSANQSSITFGCGLAITIVVALCLCDLLLHQNMCTLWS